MNRVLLAGVFSAMAATSAAADPFFGVWQTPNTDGTFYHVKVQQCGATICGKMVKYFKANMPSNTKHMGKNLLYDMTNTGGSNYKGKAWRPSDGKVFVGKATVSGNAASMKGCVLGGLLCQSQKWVRVN